MDELSKTDEIKQLLHFLLVGGNSIEDEQLLHAFSMLADLSGISDENDFTNVGINSTTMFAENSLKLFSDAETSDDYDVWIEYYKNELVKVEEYQLIIDLEL